MTEQHKRGEYNSCAKLTDRRVRDARYRVLVLSTFTIAEEADWNNVTPSTMANAVKGRTWRHVPMPEGFSHATPRRNGAWYAANKKMNDEAARVATEKTDAELEPAKSPGKQKRLETFTPVPQDGEDD